MNRRTFIRSGVAAIGATLGVGSAAARSIDKPNLGVETHKNRAISNNPELLRAKNPRVENHDPETDNRTVLFDVRNISDSKYVENGYVYIDMLDGNGEQVEKYVWPKTGMEIMPGEITTVRSVVPDGDKWEYVVIRVEQLTTLPAWAGAVRHGPF